MRDEFLLRKIRQFGKHFGYRLADVSKPAALFTELIKYREGGEVVSKSRQHDFLAFALHHFGKSYAQLCQDLFALYMTGCKRGGYFVEFGATNGRTLSNTLLLETDYGWQGILAEPARSWHEDLRRNRHCNIETRCVWSRSGEQLQFNEVREGELSTIASFSDADGHMQSRQHGVRYMVESISLNDLLDAHGAPSSIDYMSVDTEGTEYTILSHFDFTRRDIRLITVEHNFTMEREKIRALLQANGYVRMFEGFSQWDDWYVKP